MDPLCNMQSDHINFKIIVPVPIYSDTDKAQTYITTPTKRRKYNNDIIFSYDSSLYRSSETIKSKIELHRINVTPIVAAKSAGLSLLIEFPKENLNASMRGDEPSPMGKKERDNIKKLAMFIPHLASFNKS